MLLLRNTASCLFSSDPEVVQRQIEKKRDGLLIADENEVVLEMKDYTSQAILPLVCKWLHSLRVISASLPGSVGVLQWLHL